MHMDKLFSLSSDIDSTCCMLEELNHLLDILAASTEEGYQLKCEYEDWKAFCYINQIPMQQALLSTIQRELTLRIKELNEAIDQLVEMCRKDPHHAPETPAAQANAIRS